MINLHDTVLAFAKGIVNQPNALFLQHYGRCESSPLAVEELHINAPSQYWFASCGKITKDENVRLKTA
jgi:hypothetical protein